MANSSVKFATLPDGTQGGIPKTYRFFVTNVWI